MDYRLNDIIKRRLRQIGKTWTWLAEQCGVARETLNNKTMVFDRMTLEEIFFISDKIEMNLMGDYVAFLRATRDVNADKFSQEETIVDETKDDVVVWLCLKAKPEAYSENFLSTLHEIKQIGLKNGFRIE